MISEPLYLGIGSNLGDREANIGRAIELLSEALGSEPVAVSGMIETAAQGFDGPDFLNCAVRFDSAAEPLEILDRCQEVERRMGRGEHRLFDDQGNRVYESRIIDIDILMYGDRHMDTPRLTIPHPRMTERDFVMVPLRQIKDSGSSPE